MKHKIWTVTKLTVLSISFLIYAFFIFRLCSSNDPDAMQHVIWNECAAAAYQADPDAFEIWEQEPDAYITGDGRFWISNIIYLPQAKQMQLTIKYNNSTLKYLRQDIGDANYILPEEPFDYTLLDDNGIRYQPSAVAAEKKQNYNYRRIVFDDIDLDTLTYLYADMYYAEAIDYTAAPYGSLLAWHTRMKHETRDVQDELPDSMK